MRQSVMSETIIFCLYAFILRFRILEQEKAHSICHSPQLEVYFLFDTFRLHVYVAISDYIICHDGETIEH